MDGFYLAVWIGVIEMLRQSGPKLGHNDKPWEGNGYWWIDFEQQMSLWKMENQQGVREEEEGGMKVRRTRVDIKLWTVIIGLHFPNCANLFWWNTVIICYGLYLVTGEGSASQYSSMFSRVTQLWRGHRNRVTCDVAGMLLSACEGMILGYWD